MLSELISIWRYRPADAGFLEPIDTERAGGLSETWGPRTNQDLDDISSRMSVHPDTLNGI